MKKLTQKYRIDTIKSALLAELSDTKVNGRSKRGLLTRALERVNDLLNHPDPETYDKGIDKLLKLLPYCLPKIGYDKPLITNDRGNNSTDGNTFQQVNIYLENRVKSLSELKEIKEIKDITDKPDEADKPDE